MALKCNLESCDFKPCVHRHAHNERGHCTVPGKCETKDVEVCCIEIVEEQQLPSATQQPEQPMAEVEADEVEQEQQPKGMHGFCVQTKRWLDIVDGIPEDCPQLTAGDDAVPCGKQCEHYELRKATPYFSRKLKAFREKK